MPETQKFTTKNGNKSTKTRHGTNAESKTLISTSKTFFFIVGLSVVMATAAVMLMFEEVQLYLVKLSQLNSKPLESTSRADELRQSAEDSKQLKHPKDDYNTAKKKNERKDYDKSDTTREDDGIECQLDAAEKLLEEGDIEGTIQKYDKILEIKPESARALWGKSLAMDKLAEKEESDNLLEEAMNLMDTALRVPDTPEKLLMQIASKLAERQAFMGWRHKEAKTWQYLIEKYPDNLVYQNKLGLCYMMMGNTEESRRVFTAVLQKSPDDGFALVNLGYILKRIDLNYKDAIPMLQKGIDTKDEGTQHGRFFNHLGDAYMRENQTDKAREIFKRGAEIGLFLSEYQRSLHNAETKITGRPWWTPEQTTYKKYLTMLENNWEVIRDEGLAQLDEETGAFIPDFQNLTETGDWKQFMLYKKGYKIENNCKKAPKTCALIDQIPEANGCKRGQVKFSVMHPGVHVWSHTGPTNCRIRAHLGLKIPEGPRIRVVDEIRTWKEGKFIIIDDSFEHEVWHDGTELRLVLLVDFWHPEIPQHERESLTPV